LLSRNGGERFSMLGIYGSRENRSDSSSEKRPEWFLEQTKLDYAQRGLAPNSLQCIGFAVPAVFAEGGRPDTAYIADIYEHVSFLGDLHRQIANLPDGSEVRLSVHPPKPASPKPI